MHLRRQNAEKEVYYPIPVSGIDGIIYALIFGLFITLFLWFFQPFGINNQEYSFLELLVFGAISFGVFAIAHSLLPFIKPNIYKESNWTIYSQILFYVVISLVIATCNGLYINFRNQLDFSWSNYWLIITQTFAVAVLPITLSVLLSYYLKYKKIAEQSGLIKGNIDRLETTKEQQYTIQSKIKNETFLIDEMTFLFAKSNGNYIEVFTTNSSPKIFRLALSDLDEQLTTNRFMMRCHRSYIVNTKHIIDVTGNAQGLRLWFENQDTQVPVSRKYLDKVKAAFVGP
ncbi:MAG: LytTR family DNA-binding domain-containing protein [Bacteroidota bacterium]